MPIDPVEEIPVVEELPVVEEEAAAVDSLVEAVEEEETILTPPKESIEDSTPESTNTTSLLAKIVHT